MTDQYDIKTPYGDINVRFNNKLDEDKVYMISQKLNELSAGKSDWFEKATERRKNRKEK